MAEHRLASTSGGAVWPMFAGVGWNILRISQAQVALGGCSDSPEQKWYEANAGGNPSQEFGSEIFVILCRGCSRQLSARSECFSQ